MLYSSKIETAMIDRALHKNDSTNWANDKVYDNQKRVRSNFRILSKDRKHRIKRCRGDYDVFVDSDSLWYIYFRNGGSNF
jgi:hypothetical protein